MKGGSYDNRNGKMKRVAHTSDHPEGNRPRDGAGKPVGLPEVGEQSQKASPKTVKKTAKKAVRMKS
ncbi:MAG: hypothetical protein AB2604_10575 [Candidatus Thiodiazotropha taylori]